MSTLSLKQFIIIVIILTPFHARHRTFDNLLTHEKSYSILIFVKNCAGKLFKMMKGRKIMFLIGLFIVCFSLPITIRMYQILYLANFSPDPDIRLVYSWQFNIDRLTVVALLFTALTVFGILLMVIGLIAKKKIARTTIQVSYTNPEETQRSVSELLRKKGYKNIIKNNESIWKCGVGFLTAIK